MHPEQSDEALLEQRLDDICEGLREAIDREVETLRREGLPIYVSDNGRIIDLQQTEIRE
jgi:biotin operon repressor